MKTKDIFLKSRTVKTKLKTVLTCVCELEHIKTKLPLHKI